MDQKQGKKQIGVKFFLLSTSFFLTAIIASSLLLSSLLLSPTSQLHAQNLENAKELHNQIKATPASSDSSSSSDLSNLRTTAPKEARVYFITPKDGSTVSETFTVQFGLKGMGVSPAGLNKADTGHHHLLIDLNKKPSMNAPLPATDQIKHFGGGQTETELTLSKGEHTLQLLLGNHLHIPHNPPVLSEKITITVE